MVRCRAAVRDLAQRAAAAIRGGQAEAAALSLENLPDPIQLPGRVLPDVSSLVCGPSLDGVLAQLPIAALLEKKELPGQAPEYLLLHHTVELIPGVAYWLESGEGPAPQLLPLFVGLRDAIYSRADQRP